MIKKLTAILCALLLLSAPVSSVPVFADGDTGIALAEEVVERADIRITISIFENISGSYLLPPLQLTAKEGDTIEDVLLTLINYAYLEDAVVSEGQLLSITTEDGSIFKLDARDEALWKIAVNDTLYDILPTVLSEAGEETPFVFQDGDEIGLLFYSNARPESELGDIEAGELPGNTTTDTIPWESAHNAALSSGANWLKQNDLSVSTLAALGAAGISVEHKYLTRVLRSINETEATDGLTLAEHILCVSFSGISAENFSGKDLLTKLYAFPDLDRLSSVVGLLAYDCNGYTVPADALNARSAMINVIMAGQNEDGGIAHQKGQESDLLLTALSLTALAPYRDEEAIGPCVEQAIDWMASQITTVGNYYKDGTASCTATAAVILALESLSIPLSDERFCPEGNDLLSGLMDFYQQGAGFSERKDKSSDPAATVMALLALSAQKTERNPLILRSPVTGSGSIDLTSSLPELPEEEPSSQPVIDEETRHSFTVGLIGAIGGISVGVLLMLCVLLRLRRKHRRRIIDDDD